MMHDRSLRDAVIAAIDSVTTGAAVGVTADHGVVTLFGHATEEAMQAAEAVARQTTGVHAILNRIETGVAADNDAQIAEAAASFLARTSYLAGDAIAVTVQKGIVTLHGEVASDEQSVIAERALRALPMVADVRNRLRVPAPIGADPCTRLLDLLQREGVATEGLEITVDAGVVTLAGKIEHWFDCDAAERLAWTLPGVRAVANNIVLPTDAVRPDSDAGESVANI